MSASKNIKLEEPTYDASRELVKSRFTYVAARERLKLVEKDGPREKPCAVYMMTSLSGKSYIGYTTQPLSLRIYDHMLQSLPLEKKSRIAYALRKYPSLDTQWEFNVLYWARDEEEAKRLEIRAIAEHDTFQKGYNGSTGGEKTGASNTTSKRIQRSNENKRQQRYKLNHCLFEHAEKNQKEPPK